MGRWTGLKEKLNKNRKKAFAAYLVICLIILAAGIAKPHDRYATTGLEGIGRASVNTATPAFTENDRMVLSLPTFGRDMEDVSFYFTAGENVFESGELVISSVDPGSGDVLATERHDLTKLKEEGFFGVAIPEEFTGDEIQITVSVEGLKGKIGPSIWLNTEAECAGTAVWNGEVLAFNPVYNAIYTIQVHYVKQNVLTFLMLALLGLMMFTVSGSAEPTRSGNRAEEGENVKKTKKGAKAWTWICSMYNRFRMLIGLGIFLLVTAILFYHVYDVQIRKAMNTTNRVAVLRDNGEMLAITKDTAHMEQHYITEENALVGLGVRMDLSTEFTYFGTISATVTDTAQEEPLCTTVVDAATLLDGQYVGFIFDNSQSDIKGHEYIVTLDFSEELWDSGLSVFVTPEGFYENEPLYIGGKESSVQLSMNAHRYFNLFLKKYFFFMFVFTALFAAAFYYAAFMKKWKIENVFLLTILCLGVIYNFLIVPYMTPDEMYHIDMTYRHSNTLLGVGTAGENKCLKRADDAALTFTSAPNLENYKLVWDGLFKGIEDETLVEADATAVTQAPAVVYAPAILTMTVLRLLHVGSIPMLLLSRWANLLCFALMVWWAMKILPFGKTTLFVLSVLPMNMQQCTSFSYDAVITGVIVLYSAYCLHLAFSEEKVKASDVLVMGVLAIIMIYGKSGVYLPMCFLALLIPAEKFKNRRAQILTVAGMFILPLLSFVNRNTATVTQIVNTTEATSTAGIGASTAAGYTIGYFIHDPLAFVSMMMSTVTDKMGFYLQSVIGQKMGWVEIEISEAIPILFMVLLVLTIFKTKDEPLYIKAWQKWWIAFVCAASFGIILVGMLLTWTPMGNVSIEGVQGRYLLPLLPVLLMIGRNQSVQYEKDPSRVLIGAAWFMQLYAISCLIKAVLVF